MISISIVSHGHGLMLSPLVGGLLQWPVISKILVTLNIPELVDFPPDDRIQLIHNASPKGFGANHNQAFSLCNSEFFCVLNPDISFCENPFPKMIESFMGGIGLVAPIVKNLDGEIEDSARRFPSPLSIFCRRIFGHCDGYIYADGCANFYSEWVGGMCMLFKSSAYSRVGGFDEAYFMYVEDVDICTRLWKAGYKVLLCSSAIIFHDARRASRMNFHHLRWHIASLFRYFYRFLGRLPKVN